MEDVDLLFFCGIFGREGRLQLKAMIGELAQLIGQRLGGFFILKIRRNSPALLLNLIIGSFLGDDHIVNVAFFKTSRSNPDELGFGLEFLDAATATISHPCL